MTNKEAIINMTTSLIENSSPLLKTWKVISRYILNLEKKQYGQLTIEELREQFYKDIENEDLLPCRSKPIAYQKAVSKLWDGYYLCAKANNLIKENLND